jgi:hypothetical protein
MKGYLWDVVRANMKAIVVGYNHGIMKPLLFYMGCRLYLTNREYSFNHTLIFQIIAPSSPAELEIAMHLLINYVYHITWINNILISRRSNGRLKVNNNGSVAYRDFV